MSSIKGADIFGASYKPYINNKDVSFKSYIGAFTSISVFALSFSYLIWELYQWQSNQLLPNISNQVSIINDNYIYSYNHNELIISLDETLDEIGNPFQIDNQILIPYVYTDSFKCITIVDGDLNLKINVTTNITPSVFFYNCSEELRCSPKTKCADEQDKTQFYSTINQLQMDIILKKYDIEKQKQEQYSKTNYISVDPENYNVMKIDMLLGNVSISKGFVLPQSENQNYLYGINDQTLSYSQLYMNNIYGKQFEQFADELEAKISDEIAADKADESTADESTADESTADESTADESTANESTADESTGEESTGEESTGEESTGEESTGEESTGEESTADESTADESPSTNDESAATPPVRILTSKNSTRPVLQIQFELNELLLNTVVQYPLLGSILASVGAIVSLLMLSQHVILFINTNRMEDYMINEIIKYYYPEFQNYLIKKSLFGNKIRIFSAKDEKIEYDATKIQELYDTIRKQAQAKLSYMNIIYESTRMQFALQSLQERETLSQCQNVGIKLPPMIEIQKSINQIQPTLQVMEGENLQETQKTTDIDDRILADKDMTLFSIPENSEKKQINSSNQFFQLNYIELDKQ